MKTKWFGSAAAIGVSVAVLAGTAAAQQADPARGGAATDAHAGRAAQDASAQQAGAQQGGGQQAGGYVTSVQELTKDWPEVCKKAAMEMQQKYGQPTGMTPTRIVWQNKGPFAEIILINQAIDHNFPKQHKDCLEHVVAYDVPVEKVGELAKFDGSIIVDRTRGTLSARCDSEAHNLVALNLAHDIITGKKSVEEARQAYTKGAEAEMAGKPMPSIAKELQFQPPPMAQAGDPDVVTVDKAQGGEARSAGEQQPPQGQPDAQQQQQQQR